MGVVIDVDNQALVPLPVKNTVVKGCCRCLEVRTVTMARTRNVLAEPAKGHSRKWRRGGWADAR